MKKLIILLSMALSTCQLILAQQANAPLEERKPSPNETRTKQEVPTSRQLMEITPEERQRMIERRQQTLALVDKRAQGVNGYDTVPGDLFKTRIYTLSNGLKVYLSVNKDAPRIQTMIAVKAGSKFDPAQTTGLAHYLEHMMFKGTKEFGSKNWEKESVLLDSISANFEYHKNEKDEAKKKKIYARIDSFSYEASKFAIPNEYDKMITSLGAQGTNAFTSTDMTVYINDIPSNAVEKFLTLEYNRFQTLVLRLFHTELETVYEEFNRNQDNDRVWSDHAIDNALLPNHPYGTQTTIGEGEHLKNPSMVNIHDYFDRYYRPNNMAIILAGDLDPEVTIKLIEKTFGQWQARRIPKFKKETQPEITAPIVREYIGPQPEHVYVGFRFEGANTVEARMAKMVDMILANGSAGLIDLDLVQQQKVLQAYSFIDENTDFVVHKLYGEPKQGQKLEEVEKLLLGEIEKIKKGDFGDWLIPGIIQNLRLQKMKEAEKNDSRAYAMMSSFVHDIEWQDAVNDLNEMEKITKADIVKFANVMYGNNYAVSYKRTGEAKVHKVEKPTITSVVMNKEDISSFKKEWDEQPQPSLKPKFIDFDKDIKKGALAKGGVTVDYIKNEVNNTFQMSYIFDMGTDNIRELKLAIDYLEYLGTDKYSAEQLKTEFYKLGLSFGVDASRDRATISLSGLEANLEKGITLFEHVLANVKQDDEVYQMMVMDILQSRENVKKNKNAILFTGMVNYAKYGSNNPYNTIISEDELKKIKPATLVAMIKSLSSYKHKVFYYGSKELSEVQKVLKQLHKVNSTLKDYPTAVKYKEITPEKPTVYFCDFPMKQAEIMMVAKDEVFNKSYYPYLYLYNDYFGSGLSSILFQEIREKMALAYAVSSSFGVPQYANESHFVTAYVGTQADKMKTAISELSNLLNNMPKVPQQFDGAKASVIKTLESDWITRADIYSAYERAQKRGLNYDIRKDIYEKVKTMRIDDLAGFFNEHIKGKQYTYLVIGKKEDLNMDYLKQLGTPVELSTKEIFGF
jgi:predicted Zn-dependent peptidase